MDDFIQKVQELELHSLRDSWTEESWRNGFEEAPSVPLEFLDILQSEDLFITLDQLCSLILSSLGSEDFKWEVLVKFGVPQKTLVAFVNFILFTFSKTLGDKGDRRIYMKTAELYCLLLRIEGSASLNVYHEAVFSKVIDVLELGKYISNKSVLKLQNSLLHNNEDDEEVTSAPSKGKSSVLNTQEKKELLLYLNGLLNRLVELIRSLNLSFSEAILEGLARNISNLTRTEFIKTISQVAGSSITYTLVHNSYAGLASLCSPHYGRIESIVKLILFHLLPNMLLMEGYGFTPNFHDLCMTMNESVYFITQMLNVSNHFHKATCLLLQNVFTRVPDKADYRHKASEAVVSIILRIQNKPCFDFLKWFIQFAYSEKASHRHFALDVIEQIVMRSKTSRISSRNMLKVNSYFDTEEINPIGDRHNDDANNDGDDVVPSILGDKVRKLLICILFSKCRDIAVPVRGRALQILSDCASKDPLTVSIMEKVFVLNESDEDTVRRSDCLDYKVIYNSFTKNHEVDFPHPEDIMNVLRCLLLDDRATVRKPAVSFTECVLKLNKSWISGKNILETLSQHCRDPAPSVRKQTIQSLTSIVQDFSAHHHVYEIWVRNVLPQISDPETKVQEKVLDDFHLLLIPNITSPNSQNQRIAWKLLGVIMDNQLQKYLISACSIWSKKRLLELSIIQTLQKHIESDNCVKAWYMINALSEVMTIKNPQFVYDFYEKAINNLHKDSLVVALMIIEILQTCWKNLPEETQSALRDDILNRLNTFALPLQLISNAVNLTTLILRDEDVSKDESCPDVTSCLNGITNKCEEFLQKRSNFLILTEDEEGFELYLRHLLTLGNVVKNNKGAVNLKLFQKLTEFLFSEASFKKGGRNERFRKLVAAGIISLGKMALVNVKLAKKYVPFLGKFVVATKDPRNKINAMLILTDLCIRYTDVVEPHIPNMSICLKDSCLSVREKTLLCFIQLLQEDYIKPRGSLFFNLLSTLCDPDESIQGLIVYYIKENLLPKQPTMMFNNLTESIFYYNGYQGHEKYSQAISSIDQSYFSMSGAEHFDSRKIIYRFMLDNMNEFTRFQMTQRLVTEILGGVADGKVELSEAGLAVVKDTFFILSCDEIKLTSKSKPDDDKDVSVLTEEPPSETAKLTKTLLTEVAKKNILENMFPVLVNVKIKLEKLDSPLWTDLMHLISDLTQEFKKEINDLFASDPRYKKQVLNDLKKFEEEQKKKKKLSQSMDEGKNVDDSSDKKHKKKSLSKNEKTSVADEKRNKTLSTNVDIEEEQVISIETEVELIPNKDLETNDAHSAPSDTVTGPEETDPVKQTENTSKENRDTMSEADLEAEASNMAQRENSRKRKGAEQKISETPTHKKFKSKLSISFEETEDTQEADFVEDVEREKKNRRSRKLESPSSSICISRKQNNTSERLADKDRKHSSPVNTSPTLQNLECTLTPKTLTVVLERCVEKGKNYK